MTAEAKRVAIIGAGPVGLAAAAHALERGLDPIILESGLEAGHAIRQWGHVRMFSPWEYNVDAACGRLLTETGWRSPDPAAYPTGADLLSAYIEPLAERTALAARIRTGADVVAIGRAGMDKVKTAGRDTAPFQVRYRTGTTIQTLEAEAVIDASGTWRTPNPAGADGMPAIGEREQAQRIAYGMPDVLGNARQRYAGNTVAVLGVGHSAIGTLIDLARLQETAPETRIIWLIRGDTPEKSFGGGENDKLAARGELGASFARLFNEGLIALEKGFKVTHADARDGRLRIGAGSSCCGRHVIADELIVATGFRPEMEFLREVRTSLDPALECPPALAPLIDPNLHSCGTVRPHGALELAQPDTGLYIAGMKSYGRAPTFLMLTGYEQVRSITAEIAGDIAAARRVELKLPETGVCSGSPLTSLATTDCCGVPPKADVTACCVQDEAAKSAGQQGCGCGPKPTTDREPATKTRTRETAKVL